jgi:hypothetical protein
LAGQATPQAPQLAGSRSGSTHVDPHIVRPAGQTQLPNEQTAPPLQAGEQETVMTGVVGTPPVPPPPSPGTAATDPQPTTATATSTHRPKQNVPRVPQLSISTVRWRADSGRRALPDQERDLSGEKIRTRAAPGAVPQ